MTDLLEHPTTEHPVVATNTRTGGVPGQRGETRRYREVSVAELVALVRQGDAEAFGCVYDLHVDRVYAYIRQRVRDRQTAEDLTAEVFIRALRGFGGYTERGTLLSWLRRIALNVVIDHARRAQRRPDNLAEYGDLADVLDPPAVDPTMDPANVALRTAEAAALHAAMKQLLPKQRACVALRYLAGYTTAETAEALGLTEDAAKALLWRALRNLAVLMPEGWRR